MSYSVERLQSGETIIVNGRKLIVKWPCAHVDGGLWYCSKHQTAGSNHLNDSDSRRMVWLCDKHGPEQP
jgi:hypothetical protein